MSIYLISSVEFNQLGKFPLLVEHFTEHKARNSNLSLWEFLSVHYSESNQEDQGMSLPFKSSEDCLNTVTVAFIPNQFLYCLPKIQFIEGKDYSIIEENLFSSAYLSFIWQPPKSC